MDLFEASQVGKLPRIKTLLEKPKQLEFLNTVDRDKRFDVK